jgi:hypothetical protein
MGKAARVVVEQGSEWPGHVGDCENVVAVGYDKEGLLRDHNTFRRMLAILDTLGYPTDDVDPLEAGAQGDVAAPDWADTSPTQR